MERQQILRILIPLFIIIALNVLSEIVAKNVVHDGLLIKISLIGSFLFGFLTYWTVVKLGIN
jgi:hypothetical protein